MINLTHKIKQSYRNIHVTIFSIVIILSKDHISNLSPEFNQSLIIIYFSKTHSKEIRGQQYRCGLKLQCKIPRFVAGEHTHIHSHIHLSVDMRTDWNYEEDTSTRMSTRQGQFSLPTSTAITTSHKICFYHTFTASHKVLRMLPSFSHLMHR